MPSDPSITSTTDKTPDTEVPHESGGKSFVSKGRRIHNEITYRVIDWLMNSTIGVSTAYWVNHTHSGTEVNATLTKFFGKVTGVFTQNEKSIKAGGEWGTLFASIMAGGTAIIPLMMFMENKEHKKTMIRWMDEKIYGKDIVRNDPKFQESYNKIDEEPRKGFWRGMGSRLLALAPLLAITMAKPVQNKLLKYLYDPIGRRTQWLAEKAGLYVKTAATELEDGTKLLPEGSLKYEGEPPEARRLSNWDFIHRTIGFDFGLTFFYAILHEITYKALSASGMKKKEPSADAVHAEPAPAVHTETAGELRREAVTSGSWTKKSVREKPESFVKGIGDNRTASGQQLLL